MKITFNAYGHMNITSNHNNTFEFTKEKEVTKNGDCIVGVNSDFSLDEIKNILDNQWIKVVIKVKDAVEEVLCEVNPGFCSEGEMVFRRSGFLSERTLGIFSDKAAVDFNSFRPLLKDPKQKIIVEIETI
jgi:uncharacterized protein